MRHELDGSLVARTIPIPSMAATLATLLILLFPIVPATAIEPARSQPSATPASTPAPEAPAVRWIENLPLPPDVPTDFSPHSDVPSISTDAFPTPPDIAPEAGPSPTITPAPVAAWRKPGGLDKRSMTLLIGAISVAFLPVFFHLIAKHRRSAAHRRGGKSTSLRRSRRRSSHKDTRSAESSPTSEAPVSGNGAGAVTTDEVKSDKLSPRPRAPLEPQNPFAPSVLPQPAAFETTSRLFETTRATLRMLRNAPENLREPMIDQIGSLIDALEGEVRQSRPGRTVLPPIRNRDPM